MILDTDSDTTAKTKLMKSIIVCNVFQYELFYLIPATRVKWILEVTKLFKTNYCANNNNNNPQFYGGIAFLCPAA